MNILIGLAILLTLMLSDNAASIAGPNDVMIRIFGVFALSSIAPLVASIQVFLSQRESVQSRSFEQEMSAARFNSSIHAAIWILASLAIVCVVQWQDVVRSAWHLGQWVALDEAVILLPMLVSLVASWALFFDQHSAAIVPEKRRKARIEYVSLRCRVYLIVVLVPIAFMVLLKDL